ncbi:MAG: molybdopterin-dependent oxidoreductase [Propionibacteriales bacterium]|nr:molybdopterin-dependent oxidoreductase [Propionibacteriales bacterium]
MRIVTYPFGAHLAVGEVDVETGLVDNVGVDDVGNPPVDGQVHGGGVQGIAQRCSRMRPTTKTSTS